MSAPLRTRSALLLAAGFLAGAGVFLAQLSLPAPFRGLTCCDATIYRTQARMMVRPLGDTAGVPAPKVAAPAAAEGAPAARPASRLSTLLRTLFASTDKYMPGYGVFLAAHIFVSNLTGGALPWLEAALVTGFLLQCAAILWLWRSMRHAGAAAPAWAAALALADPTLAAHAALPISDTLGMTCLLLGLGAFLRAFGKPCTARTAALAFATGVMLALAVWVRSIYAPSLGVFFAAWLVSGAWTALRARRIGPLALAAIAAAAAIGTLSPRLIACHRASGSFCLQVPQTAGPVTGEMVRRGLVGARTYTLVRPVEPRAGSFITVPEPLLLAMRCTVGDTRPGADFVRCAARRWYAMPGYALLKTFGLLDHPFLSSYATYVTPPWVRMAMRATALPALAGLLLAGWLALLRPRRAPAWTMALLFGFLYLASVLPVTIEYRYGMPLLPLGILGLGWFLREARTEPRSRRRLMGIAAAALLAAFLWQTALWDRRDPIPYVPAGTAATEDIVGPLLPALPRTVTD